MPQYSYSSLHLPNRMFYLYFLSLFNRIYPWSIRFPRPINNNQILVDRYRQRGLFLICIALSKCSAILGSLFFCFCRSHQLLIIEIPAPSLGLSSLLMKIYSLVLIHIGFFWTDVIFRFQL